MAIIVPSPHSGCPVRVREQDMGRAVRDESGRIFYPLPRSSGGGHYGALTRAGSAEQEQRCTELATEFSRQPTLESPQPEAHDATGCGRHRPTAWLILLLLLLTLGIVALFAWKPAARRIRDAIRDTTQESEILDPPSGSPGGGDGIHLELFWPD